MLNYPLTMTKVCGHCGATVVLERHGTGRPLGGRLDYWYTADHRCPESTRAIEVNEAESRLPEETLQRKGLTGRRAGVE